MLECGSYPPRHTVEDSVSMNIALIQPDLLCSIFRLTTTTEEFAWLSSLTTTVQLRMLLFSSPLLDSVSWNSTTCVSTELYASWRAFKPKRDFWGCESYILLSWFNAVCTYLAYFGSGAPCAIGTLVRIGPEHVLYFILKKVSEKGACRYPVHSW